MVKNSKATKQAEPATRRVVLYARVSREEQAKDDDVSIDEQLAEMRVLCERNGWAAMAEYIDARDYKATQSRAVRNLYCYNHHLAAMQLTN